ncbi:MAG: YqaA family protein [Gammaproteobacteria bacterium]|nr:YqaA family protein [Gammaproteobacteria bacterium]
MKLFENLYRSVIKAAGSRQAPGVLSALSFTESFILPFPPPDVMLAPMSLAKPERATFFATITLIASVLGGVVGYAIGAFGYELAQPYIVEWGYQAVFDKATEWFTVWGFWAVLVAGFSPVPYKIFTISAGVLHLAFIPFILASLIGRGARFYLVALLLARYGAAIESRLIMYIEKIGWAIVALLCLAIVYFNF